MKLGGRKRCGKCRSCGKTKKRFSHSSLDLRSTLPTTPAATGLSSNTTFLLLPQWLIEAKLWRARRTRVEQVHVWRPRRARYGELVQWDTSEHEWLEGRGEKLYLISMID